MSENEYWPDHMSAGQIQLFLCLCKKLSDMGATRVRMGEFDATFAPQLDNSEDPPENFSSRIWTPPTDPHQRKLTPDEEQDLADEEYIP